MLLSTISGEFDFRVWTILLLVLLGLLYFVVTCGGGGVDTFGFKLFVGYDVIAAELCMASVLLD